MAGTRTRAQGASPGGFKTLDDIEKPKRGKGKGRAKKTKAEPVEPSVESESVEPYTSEAEGNNNTESQNAQSPTSNPSRTNSPESHPPSPTPADNRPESRSTSPPPRKNTTSNDASSDDAINKEQNPERSSPLRSSRKRSRVEESSIHQDDEITTGDSEEVQQPSSKRTRYQKVAGINSVGAEVVGADAEAEESTKPNRKRFQVEESSIHQDDETTRGDSEDVQQPSSKRTRYQKVAGINSVGAEVVEADAEAEESTKLDPLPEKKPRGRPARNRVKATPKPANKIRGRKQDPIVLNESSSDESPETTVSPLLISIKQEHSSADEDEHKAGQSTTSKTSPNLVSPPPGLQPTTQAEAVKRAPSLAEIGPDPEQRMMAASKHFEFPPISRVVSLSSIKLTPGMGKTARLREMLMQKHFPERLTSPSKGKEATKEVTKEVPQSTNNVAQTERKKMTAVASCTVAVFVVPGYGSDDETDMSDEDAAKVVEEPKTPEAPISPVQEASPQSSWWNPISTVAMMITSPFRKQSVAPAPVPRNKLVPPPFIFKQPPTAPSAAPLKRMSKSDRKRNNRNNIQGRLGTAGFQTERLPRHKNVERTPVHLSGILTPAEVKEIHRAQDEYAAKHQK
ncbi:hypothetical protein DID88_009397 [Monilinia fructigena]|uniref:Uncharacterized protein n=1 Tax=Monilinia fructigena TaxID=38457 RepID=A0A395IPH8_9HELO|nr:hypothetical protein DID88_009397 [Monilinia fructigena]